MPSNVLVNKSGEYGGLYVATKSFVSKKVIASGDSPSEVLEEARELGIPEPVIFYVPEEESVHIY